MSPPGGYWSRPRAPLKRERHAAATGGLLEAHASGESLAIPALALFARVRSPNSSREMSYKAIASARPKITRLGDTADEVYSFVKISGRYFMGPFDGGKNTVRFRSKRATHLPVSRSTIYSWVPDLDKGSAPVTVTTQDGRSDQKPFRVKGNPWWKLW